MNRLLILLQHFHRTAQLFICSLQFSRGFLQFPSQAALPHAALDGPEQSRLVFHRAQEKITGAEPQGGHNSIRFSNITEHDRRYLHVHFA